MEDERKGKEAGREVGVFFFLIKSFSLVFLGFDNR